MSHFAFESVIKALYQHFELPFDEFNQTIELDWKGLGNVAFHDLKEQDLCVVTLTVGSPSLGSNALNTLMSLNERWSHQNLSVGYSSEGKYLVLSRVISIERWQLPLLLTSIEELLEKAAQLKVYILAGEEQVTSQDSNISSQGFLRV